MGYGESGCRPAGRHIQWFDRFSNAFALVLRPVALCNAAWGGLQSGIEMAKTKDKIFEVACPDCGAMLRIDATTGLVVSHTSAPRKRMFEDLETAAQAMRAQDERKESLFRQGVEAEKNKEDLFEKKFAEALRKAKDGPQGKPLREFDLD